MADLFEDFAHGPLPNQSTGAVAEDALESFEKGYKAGWDDASNAHAESQAKASSVLVRNLETIEFTIAEARGLVLSALAPVLSEVADTLLPGLAEQALRALLVSELQTLLSTSMPEAISLEVSPDDFSAVSALLETADGFDNVTAEKRDTLGAGQITVSCESASKRIDVPAALSGIQDALNNLSNQSLQEQPEIAHAG